MGCVTSSPEPSLQDEETKLAIWLDLERIGLANTEELEEIKKSYAD